MPCKIFYFKCSYFHCSVASSYDCSMVAMWECEGGSGKWYQGYYLQPRLPGTHLAGVSSARQTPPRSSSIPRWSRPSSTSHWLWRQIWLNDVPLEGNLFDHGPGIPLQVSWTYLWLHKFHPNFSSSRWKLTIPKHQGVTLDLCNSLWVSEYTSYQFYSSVSMRPLTMLFCIYLFWVSMLLVRYGSPRVALEMLWGLYTGGPCDNYLCFVSH